MATEIQTEERGGMRCSVTSIQAVREVKDVLEVNWRPASPPRLGSSMLFVTSALLLRDELLDLTQ